MACVTSLGRHSTEWWPPWAATFSRAIRPREIGIAPHAAFTLLRAYLELVVLTYYVNDHYEYLNALEQPMAELPRGSCTTFAELFDYAAPKMPGVRKVYEVLSEMAHFGSTALWQPFTVSDTEEAGTAGRLSFSTAPHWMNPDTDPRMALAMLQETDEATLYILGEFAQNHILPHSAALTARVRGPTLRAQAGPG